ncbi:MAG: LysM peptidoglycan-binding domain-containing protein [Deltaproteobacteria bacterium]|nr:LysM peptidoglycan-binding domain-containing protein [Deltaproteobacteria bacterium]
MLGPFQRWSVVLGCSVAVWSAGGRAGAEPPADGAGVDEDEGESGPASEEEDGSTAEEGEESAGAEPAGEEQAAGTGEDDEAPTRAEARLVEQLSLGTPAIVHRLTSPGGVTARYLRAAGGTPRPSYLSYPIPGARLARSFGSGTNGRHKAMDIIADAGTPIRAAERGLVVYADDTIRGYGWMVVLLHPGGWVTFYAHCKKLLVHPGETVERREVIARVGDTGIARGTHVHFTLFIQGQVADPYPFIRPPPPNLPYVGPQPHRGHRVREGDTVDSVAATFEVDAAALREANGMATEEELQAGWQILIPGQLEPRVEETDEAPARRYTVREGDTVSEIAQRFGTTSAVIVELSHLRDAAQIRVGQELRVPGGGGGGGDEEGTRPDTAADDIYVVEEGDTLLQIAQRHDVSVRQIRQANRLRDEDDIRVGQELVIPTPGANADFDEGRMDGRAWQMVTVREGDSLSRIARRHHCSVDDILDMNPRLRDADSIRPGDDIRVPKGEE